MNFTDNIPKIGLSPLSSIQAAFQNSNGPKHEHFLNSLRDFGIGLNLNQMFDLANDKNHSDGSYDGPPTIIKIASSPTHMDPHKHEIENHPVSHKHNEGAF